MRELNRRQFVGGLIAATTFASNSGLVFDDDPERLLHVPGAKKIFIRKYDIMLIREQLLEYFWNNAPKDVLTVQRFAELRDFEWERTPAGVIYKRKWQGGVHG